MDLNGQEIGGDKNLKNDVVKIPSPSLGLAVLPLIAMAGLLGVGFGIYHIPPPILLIAAAVIAAVYGLLLRIPWREMEMEILRNISKAMPAVLIMLSVGVLIGSWMSSGTIPMIISYGLKYISPKSFLFTACLVCSLASLATGTSWGTVGTLGVAFMGIARGLDIPPALAAGAIVGGAYFGDKMSPFSDVANLAPVATGANLFDHIRHMFWSATPAWLTGMGLYYLMGLRFDSGVVRTPALTTVSEALNSHFKFHVLLLLPIAVIFAFALMKKPTIPSILLSSITAGILAIVVQGQSVRDVASAMNSGYRSDMGVEIVDALLSQGGLSHMLDALMIAFAAFAFGGIMQRTGALNVILDRVMTLADKTWSLVMATIGSSLMTALITGNPYLAMLIPGGLLSPVYRRRGLAAKNLSRIVEESGAIVIPLIPWSMGGVFCAGTLGVSTLSYLPWAFMIYLSVAVLAFYGLTGITMAKRIREDETQIGS